MVKYAEKTFSSGGIFGRLSFLTISNELCIRFSRYARLQGKNKFRCLFDRCCCRFFIRYFLSLTWIRFFGLSIYDWKTAKINTKILALYKNRERIFEASTHNTFRLAVERMCAQTEKELCILCVCWKRNFT